MASWFAPTATTGSPGDGFLLAQLFFPTNKSYLDANDKLVLTQLEHYLRSALRNGERVELSIVGHADHRHDDHYNKTLAYERAKSVARELNQRLGNESHFSAYSALPAGEKYAHQGTADPQALAFDRRVDVWSSSAIYRLPELPALEKIPQLLRLVFRSYSDVKPIDEQGGRRNYTRETLSMGTDRLLSGSLGVRQPVPGEEDVSARKYVHQNASFRVNVVEIQVRYSHDQLTGAELDQWHSTVSYTWGPPLPSMIVNRTKQTFLNGAKDQTHFRTGLIDRVKGEKDPFLFPPPLARGD